MKTRRKKNNRKEGSKGPGAMETEDENDRFLRAAKAADRGQLRTAARLLRGSNLRTPTEATAEAIEQLYHTDDAAQSGRTLHVSRLHIRRRVTSDSNTFSRTSAMHKRQAHPGPSLERATFQLSWCRHVVYWCLHNGHSCVRLLCPVSRPR